MSEAYIKHGQKKQGDIAIVGMASHFPDATNLHEFWENIVSKRDSLTDISTMSAVEYWCKEDFYDPDVNATDKTYACKAGFVPAIEFDPVEFKIPPAVMDSVSSAQLFALYTARQAMQDAGLLDNKAAMVDRDRIGVILGGGGNGNTSFSLLARQQAPRLREIMIKSGLNAEVADEIITRAHNLYLEWDEDSFPGFLGNVACGRIASYFDLGGTSYMVDAACASSLAAIKAAIGELNSGSCDVVLTGGINLECSSFAFLCFSKTPALSKSNRSRPFDSDADGIMLGDGVGLLVLKRLEDAERAGDRIYAVIKSLEASSDGRAKSIFAPRYEGQVKALKRAYDSAGIQPGDIQLIEAHGTGTESGDTAELKSLGVVFSEQNLEANSIALGSIKSQIGHTRCAAGAASMIKVALALHQKVLPPSINVQQPVAILSAEDSPFYLNSETRPWLRPPDGRPRRAALSAFGFGGTNFHAILEEYQQETNGAYRLNESSWTLLFHDDLVDSLLQRCEQALEAFTDCAASAMQRHLAAQDIKMLAPHQARLVLVASSAEHAGKLLHTAVEQLRHHREEGWAHPHGIYFQPEARPLEGKVVALFPGQGAQYVNMGRDVAIDYPEMRQSLDMLDKCAIKTRGQGVSATIYPPPAFTDDERDVQRQRLTNTANAQPAIGAVSAGYYAILKANGFTPDFIAGHSYGELTALWASGALSDEDFYRVSLARGSAAAESGKDGGAMLAAALAPEARETLLARYPDIVLANDNSPTQVVLGGSRERIQTLCDELKASHVQCRILPVSTAFHTPFLQKACAPFLEQIASVHFNTPHSTVFSSASAEPWPADTVNYAQTLSQQLIMPVRFRETIEAVYQQGGRLFIDIGPKGVLGKLVADTLKGREHTIISLNTSDSGEERLHLARAQARLLAEGVRLHTLDSHVRPAPVKADLSGRLTCRLSGGFYLSEKYQRRRQYALREGDTDVVDRFIRARGAAAESAQPPRLQSSQFHTSGANQKREQTMEPMNQHPENGDIPLDGILQAQQVMSQLHQQFQNNQKEYIQLLQSLLNKQSSLLENFRDHPNLPTILASLGQSVQLLDKNLEMYHSCHEHYFSTQQGLFQLGQMPVVTHAVNTRIQPLPVATATIPVPRPLIAEAPVVVATSPERQMTKPDNTTIELEAEQKVVSITGAEITARLVAIVSERTGYPQDMIDVNMDLEADLGIDSIKRLEIFGAMFDSFSDESANQSHFSRSEDIESFDIGVLNNIQKMSAFFKQKIDEFQRTQEIDKEDEKTAAEEDCDHGNGLNKPDIDSAMPAIAEAELTKKFSTESQPCVTPVVQLPAETKPQTQRFRVIPQSLPAPDADMQTFAVNRHWLIVDEGKTIGDVVTERLMQVGQTVSVLVLHSAVLQKQGNGTNVYSLANPDETGIDNIITQIEQDQGPIDGVIWLQAARERVKKIADVFSEKGYRSLETTFLLAKRMQESLNRGEWYPGWFFVVTRGDGQLSLSGKGGLTTVLPAGVSGMIKSLNIEWKTAFCRMLDIDVEVKSDDAAHILMEELQDVRRELAEVGRSGRHERMALTLSANAMEHDNVLPVTERDVLVVTGGARGITAQCIIALSQRSKARFILLGRTDNNVPLPVWAQGVTRLTERKAAAIAHLQAQGVQPTPVKIDAMLSSLQHNDEINATVQQITQAGGAAIYRHCDITDVRQVAAVLAETRQVFGPVTGIIHGAGNLADKRIEKKTRDDLRSVFDVKVKGLENLCRVLDITALRHVILFSSVSAFFGNAGQTDYAMANETLNKFAWLPIQASGQPNVRAINWGPWDGGMVNETLKRAYETQNMAVVAPETGAEFFVREFTDVAHPQVIIGGDNYRAKWHSHTQHLTSRYEVTRRLHWQNNPFLQHHVINGHPVLPATAAIAWMTRVCEERFPGFQLLTVSNFMILKGIVFDGNEAERYRVTLMPQTGELPEGVLAVDVLISSQQEINALNYYQATLLIARQGREMPLVEALAVPDSSVPLAVPLYGDMAQGAQLFHGESFRSIQQVVHIDEQSLILKCCLTPPDLREQGQFPVNSFNLFINDVALQLPLLWLMQRSDKAGLPAAIGAIEQYSTLNFDQTFYASMRMTSQTESQLLADITLHDQQGKVYSRFEKVKTIASASLRLRFTRPEKAQVQPANGG